MALVACPSVPCSVVPGQVPVANPEIHEGVRLSITGGRRLLGACRDGNQEQ